MYTNKKIKTLLKKVEALEISAANLVHNNEQLLSRIHSHHQISARNLLHYLAIRAHDLSPLQEELSALGISSIGHAEAHTLDSLSKIKHILKALAGEQEKENMHPNPDQLESSKMLRSNSAALFGKVSFEGQSKIMVTLPSEAADDYKMVSRMVKKGMHIARINTAHDDAAAWQKMVDHVKMAAHAANKQVKLYMDIEGPKIRTGIIKQSDAATNSGKKEKKPGIHLCKGDKLTLIREGVDMKGKTDLFVELTLGEIFGHVKHNEAVWFDDGKLGGIICHADADKIIVEITYAPEEGFKLKAEKGVNFPDSDLNVAALTNEDIDHLNFIARHADMVGYSFVQRPEDVVMLQQHLKQLNREDIGIILKIETHTAFKNFPALLFAVMGSKNCGVMIARGDLAVDIGYSRIAEVQEEILWLAEAAHLPVVWATQVLETQIKKGMATRAEISDVVKAVRAECVMLNKGPHVLEAIETIKDIDKRMAAHEDKKRKILRSLNVAKTFIG